MRIRPFFWCLLATVCISVLLFAANAQINAPALLQVYVDQQPPTATGITTLHLHLTDAQGLPIEEAQVLPDAYMTNMNMTTNDKYVRAVGQGNYKVQIHLYMAGPWAITIRADAAGFLPSQKTLFVQVV
ncbi:MAG: FixH family protein [Ktedonobacteraceae bacterium]|nr:FixH family protein [Ktedonobacteraceae bacterium]MBV9615459.1 FixH family protein [Ktedonobacteraceae bacterium]MBV9712107.1 FixH family protein [Ktedonobacteraceae bacterium]